MPSAPNDPNKSATQQEEAVRAYYDDNTKMFLKLGQHAGSAAIHQPLYLSKGARLLDAVHAQHKIILDELMTIGTPAHIVDLGCGVGASMIYLAQNSPDKIRFSGITLSPKQASNGQAYIEAIGLSERIRIRSGSYLDIPHDLDEADIAFAIESFIHATDPDQFFKEVSRLLKVGGKLVIFDDLLVTRERSEKQDKIIQEFGQGWQANTLLTSDQIIEIAQKHNLKTIETIDHTKSLRFWRLRDRMVAMAMPVVRTLARKSSYFAFLIGGNARQQALRQGLIAYYQLTFQKNSNA